MKTRTKCEEGGRGICFFKISNDWSETVRVQLKESSEKQSHLSRNQKYIVFSIEFTRFGETYYRIENDANRIIPYNKELFNVMSDKQDREWITLVKRNQESIRLPREIAYLSFWEEFYNDEPRALDAFKQVKTRLFLEEFEDYEINAILKENNDDKIRFVLDTLMEVKCENYKSEIIQVAKTRLEVNRDSEGVLLAAFQYLSLFQEVEINDFFVYYLTHIELGNDELTEIVRKYFNVV